MNRQSSCRAFRESAAKAVKDAFLQEAIHRATDTFIVKRAQGVDQIPFEELRDRASDIRLQALNSLPSLVEDFAAKATRSGAVVHRAPDAKSARDIVFHILKDRRVRRIVKAKSMITEEIGLNPHIESRGMRVVETDLGEYIVQLAEERPSHLLAPAIHKTRQQIGELFSEKLGVAYSEDPEILTRIAREALREEFLAAEAGITGANFALAESGSLVIFTNEGNARMVTTLPRLHVAVFSIEKMLPSFRELSTFIRLLPRSAAGQTISSYVSIITGTRKQHEFTGAKELHIVLLDNGRSKILQTEFREILKCIRCSACLNVCPVYRVIGGHAYGSTYVGPMGVVLTTMLEGMQRAQHLLDATTLCGACAEVCPVKVPLVKLLNMLREQRVREGLTTLSERLAMRSFGMAVESPSLFRGLQKTLEILWPLLKAFSPDGLLKRLPKPGGETYVK